MAQHEVTAERDAAWSLKSWERELTEATGDQAYHAMKAQDAANRMARARNAIVACKLLLGQS